MDWISILLISGAGGCGDEDRIRGKIEFADEVDGLSLLGQKPMVRPMRSDGSKSISFIPCVI